MKVVPVPVREDNYAYLLIDSSNKAAAVDPFDVPKVQAAAQKLGVEIIAGITTHHHFDHSGGNERLAAEYKGIPIYGGSKKAPAVTHLVGDKDEFKIGDSIHVKCLSTPCHTQDSICYHVTDPSDSSHPGGVFTGDTLFVGGSGRFFEGTGAEMHAALSYLGTLPPSTVVYNGHEYTKGNVAFGASVDPENEAVKRLQKLASTESVTTGKTTIADEKEWNVFMRLDTEAVKEATKATADMDAGAVMDALREQKNHFRG